jgi:hemerythrin-like domain-containing protein
MARRHPSLIPLSRDHHDGLFLALRLKQGKKALLRLWSHDPFWQASYVVEFYRKHLAPHFKAEEKVLFPAMKKHARESVKAIEKLLEQHQGMRKRIQRLEKPKAVGLPQDLKDFGELLDQHIWIEERELFPIFEKSMPDEVAKAVGLEIEAIDKQRTR